jgi:hypothetical protein
MESQLSQIQMNKKEIQDYKGKVHQRLVFQMIPLIECKYLIKDLPQRELKQNLT